jgi:MYXO-CTERM domain-containing protein
VIDPRTRGFALALLVLALPAPAFAWCPTLTEGPPQPADFSDCAPRLDRHTLFWAHRCTAISLSSASPSSALSTDEITAVFERGLAQWETADCGSGVTTGLDVAILGETNACSFASHNTSGHNVSSVIFIDDADVWSRVREHDARAFAVTFVWHDRNTGEIFDGDIEINESRGELTVCPDAGCADCPPEGCGSASEGVVDLGNVVTHELGHYFGISHTTSDHRDATMWAQAPFGEIIKRTIEPDDIDAICSTYPPGAFDESCDRTPQGGLGLDCQPGGCGCAAPGVDGSARGGLAMLLLALALVLARRRR